MKRFFLLSVLAGILPLTAAAQDDDLYFTPKKGVDIEIPAEMRSRVEPPTYYSGSDRDVDEYNRRGKLKSYYQKIGTDSLGNDIIEFRTGDGTYGVPSDTTAVYPGSGTYYGDEDDYACTRRMGMYDDYYGWYSPYYYGYWGGPYWAGRFGWYDPWFDGWYDPWYYSSWYGWGYPYYHHYGWWGGPAYGGGGPRYAYNGVTGTRNHGPGSFATGRMTNGNFGGYRGSNTGTRGNNQRYNGGIGNFGGQRRSSATNSNRSYSNSDFGRSNSSNFGGQRSSGFSGSNSFGGGSSFGGGGSFGGGSRGGGFSGGGGGGHFGGRR